MPISQFVLVSGLRPELPTRGCPSAKKLGSLNPSPQLAKIRVFAVCNWAPMLPVVLDLASAASSCRRLAVSENPESAAYPHSIPSQGLRKSVRNVPDSARICDILREMCQNLPDSARFCENLCESARFCQILRGSARNV